MNWIDVPSGENINNDDFFFTALCFSPTHGIHCGILYFRPTHPRDWVHRDMIYSRPKFEFACNRNGEILLHNVTKYIPEKHLIETLNPVPPFSFTDWAVKKGWANNLEYYSENYYEKEYPNPYFSEHRVNQPKEWLRFFVIDGGKFSMYSDEKRRVTLFTECDIPTNEKEAEFLFKIFDLD